jgi:hypothetical protein
MSSAKSDGEAKLAKRSSELVADGYRQVIELLQLAEKSKYSEIRVAAVKMATETSRYQRKQGARLSPNLVVILGIAIIVVAVLACWYAFVNYPDHLARELSGLLFLSAFVLIGLYARLSGHLSEANFMRILEPVAAKFKSMWPGSSSKQIDRLQAQAGDSLHDEDDDKPNSS